MTPTAEETIQRDRVLSKVVDFTERGERIMLPRPDGSVDTPGESALLTVGLEPNDFGGRIGEYRYQFEGEDDLLHLMIVRLDQEPFPPGEGQMVASFVLPDLPAGLVWLKPGERSHHFYMGHDDLLDHLKA